MEQSSYIITTIIIQVLIIACWVWNAVIKFQEKRSWHSYGCIILAISYAMLIWVDYDVYKNFDNKLVIGNYMKVYFSYLLQLGAVISFMLFAYTKDHAK